MNDKEVVREQYLNQEKDSRQKDWAPDTSDMTAQMRALMMIYNRLGDVTQAVFSTIQVPSGKARPRYKGKPFPGPETVLDQIKEEEARETGMWMIATFMPHAADSWSD